jgi:DNA repair protein RadC
MPDNKEASGKSDRELLEEIVRPASRADEILRKHRIEDLVFTTRKELSLSQASYSRLMAAIELGRRVQEIRAEYQTPRKIGSSSDAISFCQIHFARLIADSLQEEFHIVTLNTKNHVIDTHLITVGTLDASLVHPREVFRAAIKDSASSVLLVHNHPSTDPTPSREDFQVTSRLEEVGRVVGIDILDHIVLAKGGAKSVREER